MGKWAAFWVLGLVWGSSYLLIRISVEELNQFELVFIRTAIAAVGLSMIAALQRKWLTLNLRNLAPLALIGIGHTAIPFVLITWGEKSVESGLTSVLQATTTLFSMIVAHYAFADERITPQKIAGLVVGFVGVMVLASRSWVDGQVVGGSLLGQGAIVVASLFYAIFAIYSRKVIRDRYEPIQVSAGSMAFAALVTGVITYLWPLFGGPAPRMLAELSPNVLYSAITLGFLNTLIAYLIFYALLPKLGASRTAMVTYVIPPVGLALGVAFLGETVDARLLVGAALIFAGIGVVNLRPAKLMRLAVASTGQGAK